MPKVSDYELEHFSEDEEFQPMKRDKRKKPVKEKKYVDDKKEYRKEWKKNRKAKEVLTDTVNESEDDFVDE